VPSLLVAFSSALFFMALSTNQDKTIADLNEPIFVGQENATINFKILLQSDPVIFHRNNLNYKKKHYANKFKANPLVKALSVGIFVLLFFSYLATIICYQRIKAFLKANMQTDVVHGVNRKTLNKIIQSMLIQVG
jgi:hypothetical protein